MIQRASALALCLLAVPAVADPQPVATEKADFWFPSAMGDCLVFEQTSTGDGSPVTSLVTRRVRSVDRTSNMESVTIVEEAEGAESLYVSFARDLIGSHVYLVAYGGRIMNPPFQVGPYASYKSGTTWEAGDTRYTVGGEEEVEVPAGKYKAIRGYREVIQRDGKIIRVTEWEAPGLGLIKSRKRLPDGKEVVRVLKSCTPGEK